MDRRERVADPLVSLGMQLAGLQSRIWTALPAMIESYDATKLTATVQVTVQPQVRNAEGKWENKSIPVLLDCPVSFPRGGGFGCTFPLVAGDEGIVIFSSRCIDAWWQSGGVQPQAEYRMHDLSDGMFVPGICSTPNVPENVSTTAARFWKEDGTMYVELDSGSGSVTAKAPVQIVLDAPSVVVPNGNLAVTGNIDVVGDGHNMHISGTGDIIMDGGGNFLMTGGDIVADGIGLKTHKHTAQGAFAQTTESQP